MGKSEGRIPEKVFGAAGYCLKLEKLLITLLSLWSLTSELGGSFSVWVCMQCPVCKLIAWDMLPVTKLLSRALVFVFLAAPDPGLLRSLLKS